MSAVPETVSQARTWQRVRDHYRSTGLCDRCAAQAAWAHQDHGDQWVTIHPPCPRCAPIVATFPDRTPSGSWRKCIRPSNCDFAHPLIPPKAVVDSEIGVQAL